MGVLLFSTNTKHLIQSIFGQLGLSVAYSSTVNRLYSMSNTMASSIHKIGKKWMNHEVTFHIVYDNINQYHKTWHPSIASQTSLESRTATTLIMYPSIHPDTFNGYEYLEGQQQIRQKDVTVMKIWHYVDCKHLESVCIINILLIMLKHILGLKHFKSNFNGFWKKNAK